MTAEREPRSKFDRLTRLYLFHSQAVYVVISLSIFPIKGKLPPDLASRIHFLAYLLEHTGNRLMVLVDHMGSLSELAGYVARVAGVLDVIGWDRLPAT